MTKRFKHILTIILTAVCIASYPFYNLKAQNNLAHVDSIYFDSSEVTSDYKEYSPGNSDNLKLSQLLLGMWQICQTTDDDLFLTSKPDSLRSDTLFFHRSLDCTDLKLTRGCYTFNSDSSYEYGFSPYEAPIADGILHGVYIQTHYKENSTKPKWLFDEKNGTVKIGFAEKETTQFKVLAISEKEMTVKIMR